MPKRNPERLTPASIVTYVLDRQAQIRFSAHQKYIKKHPDYKKRTKKTAEQLKAKKIEYNKKYYDKIRTSPYQCDCGAEINNIPWYVIRHFKSEKHINFIKNNGDKINELD